MAGRSANTNRNGGSAFCPRLANLLQRNLCARISSAGNCDRFLHTYRIPQAVPRILGIPDGSRASRRKKKRKRGGRRLGRGREKRKRQRQRGRRTRSFRTVTPPIPKVSGNASNAAISSISFPFALTHRREQ